MQNLLNYDFYGYNYGNLFTEFFLPLSSDFSIFLKNYGDDQLKKQKEN